MAGKRIRQRKQFSKALALGKVQTGQTKGRDKAMLHKKSEYWQEVNSE